MNARKPSQRGHDSEFVRTSKRVVKEQVDGRPLYVECMIFPPEPYLSR